MKARPDPDPMLRYISDEEAPACFWQMPPDLRSDLDYATLTIVESAR